MLPHQAVLLCAGWAAQQGDINRVYFYGSRVWGAPRANSDLDILVVANPGTMICCSQKWSSQLSQLLGFTVHLNDYFTADRDLVGKIKLKGILAFSRNRDESDFYFEDELPEFDPNEN